MNYYCTFLFLQNNWYYYKIDRNISGGKYLEEILRHCWCTTFSLTIVVYKINILLLCRCLWFLSKISNYAICMLTDRDFYLNLYLFDENPLDCIIRITGKCLFSVCISEWDAIQVLKSTCYNTKCNISQQSTVSSASRLKSQTSVYLSRKPLTC